MDQDDCIFTIPRKPGGKGGDQTYSAPVGDDDTWSAIAAKEYEANLKAQNSLFLALNEDDTTRVMLAQRPSTLVLMMINSCSYVY